MKLPTITECNEDWAALDALRSGYSHVWSDIAQHMAPKMYRADLGKTNGGGRDDDLIVNETTRLASRVMVAGMMSGSASPARPWMKVQAEDPGLNTYKPAQVYLSECTRRIHAVLRRSNFYDVAPLMFGDLGHFGTTLTMTAADHEDVVRFYHQVMGSYVLGTNRRRRVDTCGWDYRTTLRNVVSQFGADKLSPGLAKSWEKGERHKSVDVRVLIKPNPNHRASNPMASRKAWVAYYWEKGDERPNRFLRVSGYDQFPGLAPRWSAPGEDVWGCDSPGWLALGTTKAMQEVEKGKLLAHELNNDPPLNVPRSMAGDPVSIAPAGINYYDDRAGVGKGVFPVHQSGFDTSGAISDLEQMEGRVSRAFYVDMFLMLDSIARQGRDPTATEVRVLQDEKLLQLGPLQERVNNEMLGPTVDRVWDLMDARDLLPPPPPELYGMNLQVEFISPMAQAMKLAGLAGIERYTSMAANIAQIDPGALDKYDGDEAMDSVADILGVPPKLNRSDEEVAEIRQSRRQQEAAQAQAAAAQQAAETAKTLAAAPLDDGNALSNLIQATGGL